MIFSAVNCCHFESFRQTLLIHELNIDNWENGFCAKFQLSSFKTVASISHTLFSQW